MNAKETKMQQTMAALKAQMQGNGTPLALSQKERQASDLKNAKQNASKMQNAKGKNTAADGKIAVSAKGKKEIIARLVALDTELKEGLRRGEFTQEDYALGRQRMQETADKYLDGKLPPLDGDCQDEAARAEIAQIRKEVELELSKMQAYVSTMFCNIYSAAVLCKKIELFAHNYGIQKRKNMKFAIGNIERQSRLLKGFCDKFLDDFLLYTCDQESDEWGNAVNSIMHDANYYTYFNLRLRNAFISSGNDALVKIDSLMKALGKDTTHTHYIPDEIIKEFDCERVLTGKNL